MAVRSHYYSYGWRFGVRRVGISGIELVRKIPIDNDLAVGYFCILSIESKSFRYIVSRLGILRLKARSSKRKICPIGYTRIDIRSVTIEL
jgi:hypothetical protein